MSGLSFTASIVMQATIDAISKLVLAPSDADENVGPRIVPLDLRRWLARLRLLEGVPFSYLVADSQLLPPESIRFFYIDRNWTDALIEGALSVGTANSADRAQLEQLYASIRNEIDEEERYVRMPGGEQVQQGPAGTITGFLLRSRAVSGWPAMHVRAYRKEMGPDNEIIPESDPNRVKLLRLERLAPAVMLALFDGVPVVMHLEEPRSGIQFGVRLTQTPGTNQFSAYVIARDVTTSTDVKPENHPPVYFRHRTPGVLDFKRTAQELMKKEAKTNITNLGPDLNSAELALEMIRFPYRQVFGDPSHGAGPLKDVFRPAISMAALKTSFQEAMK
jgi:hypothetical protein